jgi:hypothetical protein
VKAAQSLDSDRRIGGFQLTASRHGPFIFGINPMNTYPPSAPLVEHPIVLAGGLLSTKDETT